MFAPDNEKVEVATPKLLPPQDIKRSLKQSHSDPQISADQQPKDSPADPPPSKSSSVDRFFLFEVQNETDQIISLAVVSLAALEANDWLVTGWYNVKPHSRTQFGPFVRGNFYATARNAKGDRWNGSDYSAYVDPVNGFSRVISSQHYGNRGDEFVGFYKFLANESVLKWTLTS